MLQIILQDEIAIRYEGSRTAKGTDVERIIKPTTMIVASMHKNILKAYIGGNLASQVQQDKKIKEQIDDLYKAGADKPLICY
jgi:phosphate uptake regulator